MSTNLFELNKALFASAFGDRISAIDWQLSGDRRDQCLKAKEPGWLPDVDHMLLAPRLMPANDQVADLYQTIASRYSFGSGINQYLEVPEEDPHLFDGLVRLREGVRKSGFDPNVSHTTTDTIRVHVLVALGTGDGSELAKLIQKFQPVHVMIAVQDWTDFTTSFWTLNWSEISSYYANSPARELTIGCYDSATKILSDLASKSISGLDHGVLYIPPTASDLTRDIQRDLTQKYVQHAINYLGFTLDEYNMVWHSWNTLKRQPKVFLQPREKIGGRYVICGSGPSLDAALPLLKQLKATHQIIACASNFRSLRKAGINVDLLVLLERGECMVEEYRSTVDEYGIGSARLLASVTSPAGLFSMFPDSAIFFRPALTPLAIFANSPREILNFEGPQTINTGIALAAALQADEVVLVGVDLGVRDPAVPRSEAASGVSPREFSLERSANFGGTVFTDRFLIDAQISVEACLASHPSLRVFNASDGLMLLGAEPMQLQTYIERCSQSVSDTGRESFDQWWDGLARYRPDRFQASWRSRRPRQVISTFFHSLRDLYEGPTPWFPDVLQRSTKMLSLDISPAEQFPRRIVRGTVHKLTLAITRQLQVMGCDPVAQSAFGAYARQIMADILSKLESECYQLCDELEKTSEF